MEVISEGHSIIQKQSTLHQCTKAWNLVPKQGWSHTCLLFHVSKIHLRTCVREKLSKSMRFVLVSKVFFNFSFTLQVAPGIIMSSSMVTKVRWPIRMSSEVVCDYQWEMLLPWPVEAPSAATSAGAFILFVLVGDNWVDDTGALTATVFRVAVGVGGAHGIRTVESQTLIGWAWLIVKWVGISWPWACKVAMISLW